MSLTHVTMSTPGLAVTVLIVLITAGRPRCPLTEGLEVGGCPHASTTARDQRHVRLRRWARPVAPGLSTSAELVNPRK